MKREGFETEKGEVGGRHEHRQPLASEGPSDTAAGTPAPGQARRLSRGAGHLHTRGARRVSRAGTETPKTGWVGDKGPRGIIGRE